MADILAGVIGLILFFIVSVFCVVYTTAAVYVAFKILGIDVEGFTA